MWQIQTLHVLEGALPHILHALPEETKSVSKVKHYALARKHMEYALIPAHQNDKHIKAQQSNKPDRKWPRSKNVAVHRPAGYPLRTHGSD